MAVETTNTEPVKQPLSPQMAQILNLNTDRTPIELGENGKPKVVAPAAQIIDPNPAPASTPAHIPAVAPVAKTEEEIEAEENAIYLKRYNKNHKTNFETIEEITQTKVAPTAEDLQKAAEAESLEAFEWALETGKFKKEDYDKSIIAKSKDKTAIAKEIFTSKYLADNPGAKAEEAEEMFKDFFALDESETSAKRKIGEKQIAEIADNYLKQYENIDKNVDNYREYKTVAQKEKSFKAQLKTTVTTLPEAVTFKVLVEKDGKEVELEYSYPITQDIKDDIVKEYTKNSWAFNAFRASDREVKETELTEAMMNTIRAKQATAMVQHVAKESWQNGRKDLLVELKAIPTTTPQPNILNAPKKDAPRQVERSPEAKERLGLK